MNPDCIGADDPTPTAAGRYAAYVAALLACWLILQLGGLWAIPFHTKGEPREALAMQDVVRGERLVLPLRNGYQMPRKPPLFHWLGGAAGKIRGGVDEGTARLPSALQSLLAALLVLHVAAVAGQPLAGLLAALAMLTSFEWLRSATSSRIDMTLAMGTTASFAGLFLARQMPARRYPLVLFYGGMIWGTLAKGPVGIVLPTLHLAATLLLDFERRWLIAATVALLAAAVAIALDLPPAAWLAGAVVAASAFAYLAIDRLRPLRPWIGYAVVLLVTASWYALAFRSAGQPFIRTQILAENFGRFVDAARADVGHQHGVGYLFGALLAGTLPWILFAPWIASALPRHASAPWRRLLVDAGLHVIVIFGFFSLASSKRSVYLLPLYPAIGLFVGHWLASSRGEAGLWLARSAKGFAIAIALLAGVLAALFALQASAVPLLQAVVEPILAVVLGADTAAVLRESFAANAAFLAALSLVTAVAAAMLMAAAELHRGRAIAVLLLATVVALEALVQYGVMPTVAPASSRAVFAERLTARAGALPILTTPGFDYATAFYLGGAVPVVDLADLPPGNALIVMPRDRWQRLDAALRARFDLAPGLAAAKQGNQAAQVVVRPLR